MDTVCRQRNIKVKGKDSAQKAARESGAGGNIKRLENRLIFRTAILDSEVTEDDVPEIPAIP